MGYVSQFTLTEFNASVACYTYAEHNFRRMQQSMSHFHIPLKICFKFLLGITAVPQEKRKRCYLCIFLCEGVGGGWCSVKYILGNVKVENLTFHFFFYHKTKVLKINNVFICKRLHFSRLWP